MAKFKNGQPVVALAGTAKNETGRVTSVTGTTYRVLIVGEAKTRQYREASLKAAPISTVGTVMPPAEFLVIPDGLVTVKNGVLYLGSSKMGYTSVVDKTTVVKLSDGTVTVRQRNKPGGQWDWVKGAWKQFSAAPTPTPVPTPTPTPTPTPVPTPTPTPTPSPSGFVVGINMRDTGPNDSAAISVLHPKVIRREISINDINGIKNAFQFYKSQGVLAQPLVAGVVNASDAQLDALAACLKSLPGCQHVEPDNELYFAGSGRAGQYAQNVKKLGQKLAGSGITPLPMVDWGFGWVAAMYAAVPDLHQYVGGWAVHPYGKQYMDIIDGSYAPMPAGGRALKMFVTEYGFASDNGRNLDNNYGWPTNQTYAQAGAELRKVVATMKASGKVAQLMVFQSTDQRPTGTSTNREHYFGLVQADGRTRKGEYTQAGIDLCAA